MVTLEKGSNLSWGLYIEDLGSVTRNTNKTWYSSLGIEDKHERISLTGFSHGFLGILCIALSRNTCLPDSPCKTCHHLVPACFSQLTCPLLITQTFPSCHMGRLAGLWGQHAQHRSDTGLPLCLISWASSLLCHFRHTSSVFFAN